MRGQVMVAAVAGKERNPMRTDRADGDPVRRVAVLGGDDTLLEVVHERVEAGTAVDADVGVAHAVFVAAVLDSDADEPDDVSEDGDDFVSPEDFVSPDEVESAVTESLFEDFEVDAAGFRLSVL
jgi:hypothetical protein